MDFIVETKTKTKIINKSDNIIDTFAKYFPNKTIKDIQYQIIKSILAKEDVLAILPTGYGKSVCYQMPYLLDQNKVVLVISPLISLMEDQKDKLEKMNIPVACFHSGVGNKKKSEIKNDLVYSLESETNNINDGMVIFITPEYIIGCELWIKKLITNDRLSLVAFDEAHCISTWGHDFRPEYQSLYRIKDWIKESGSDVPLLALTATATTTVEQDIIRLIQLENHKLYKTSFDRPNLIINVKPKTKEFNTLKEILDNYKDDFSIIYCKTRDKAEEISEYLLENDYNADCYHAGLNIKKRQEIQTKFINRELNIIVATVAFGMGIDQNIHLVIHWGCPSDMESYYQEFGRAGRDGVVSECFLFYDKQDFKISRFLTKSITNTEYKKFKNEQILMMERYCMLNQCRRKGILAHFGEKINSCTRCDNCMNQLKSNINVIDQIMYPIYIIIHTIFLIKFKLGCNKIYLIVKGSKSKAISDLVNCKTYNLLKDYTEDQIKSIINILILNGLLKEKTISSGFGSVIETTSKVVNWYMLINKKILTKDLSYNSLFNILIHTDNKLELNIPSDYIKNLSSIKIKTISDQMIEEFNI
jgi:ATP-dependent DNA helicase RecQ